MTSTQWTEYSGGTKRVQYSTVPGSSITAETVTVDGLALSQKDTAGVATTFTRSYTVNGMVLTQTDGRGNTTATVADKAGRALMVTDAIGNVTTTVYCDCCDQPATITDAQGNTTCYRYDERGRKVAEWGTAVQPASFSYDDADRLVTLTTYRNPDAVISSDPAEMNGDVTTWNYDPATGLELSKTYADGTAVVKSYDAHNRLVTETNARGKMKCHAYEHARGLLLGTTYYHAPQDGEEPVTDSLTPARSYAYNHLGQLTQVTDAAGTRTISYNQYGEQDSDSLVVDGDTHLITETRDAQGRSTGYVYSKNGATQQTVTTGYGEDGRISSAGFLHGGAEKQFSYEYLPGTHLLQKLNKPNGMSLTQSFESQRDLLIGMAYHRGTTLVAQRTYTYDTLGRPLSRSTARNGQTVNDSFGYNNRSELTTATVNGGAYAYDYDNIGNRKTAQEATEEVTGYTANELNQYTALAVDGVTDFQPEYDADGNQTRVKTSTGIWAITYDTENRPTDFTSMAADNTITTVHCEYDSMGRRAIKRVMVNGNVTLHQRYIYRGYLQIACIDLTRSHHPALWYITWDPTQNIATRPLAIQKDGTWYTCGWDLTKNICEVYRNNGTLGSSYTYTPYGQVSAEGATEQPIQWSSEFNDTELGLIYYNYRHYNPVDGRWIGRDSIKINESFKNAYIFVSNRVFDTIDQYGKLPNLYIDNDSWRLYGFYHNNTIHAGPKILPSSLYKRGELSPALLDGEGTIRKEPRPVPTWNRAFYDIDNLIPNISRKILRSMEENHELIDKVIAQITGEIKNKMKDLNYMSCGEKKWVYRTIRSYDFSTVRYALGSGTVGTVSYITHEWKESERYKHHGYFWWKADLNIYYSDIFEHPYKEGNENTPGLEWESGTPFAYYHYWEGRNSILIEDFWNY